MNASLPEGRGPDAADAPLPTGALLCLSLAAFGSGVSMRVNDALLPSLAGDFQVTLGQAAQVVSYFAIAYGLAQLGFGPAGDRYGKYRVIAWACVGSALASLLCLLAPGFDALRLARLLAGVAAAAVIPLAMAWIGDVVAYEQRQPVLARFLIGQILGLVVGVALGGFAADHLSWRVPYALLAALFLAVALALFTMNRRLPARAALRRAGQGSALQGVLHDFSHVLVLPWARVVLVVVFVEGMFLYGAFVFVASYLNQRFGLTLSAAGAVLMLFGAGGFSFAVASGALASRLGEVRLVRWGGALMSLAFAGLALAPVWWWAVPACLLLGLGFYMMHNTLQLNATQMAPERRGAAVSAFASSFFLGQSAGVGSAGWLVGQLGMVPLMLGCSLGLLATALAFARLRSARRPG